MSYYSHVAVSVIDSMANKHQISLFLCSSAFFLLSSFSNWLKDASHQALFSMMTHNDKFRPPGRSAGKERQLGAT